VNPRMALLPLATARLLRARAVRELAAVAAGAFGCSVPDSAGLDANRLLDRFAAFTAERAAAVLARPELVAPVAARLFDGACRLGAGMRRALGVRTTAEALTAARVLYRAVGIDFRAAGDEVVVRRCYFSARYSADVCRLMSALDCGVLAGLSGGGRLEFTDRLTEGHDCCRARFRGAGDCV